MSNSIYQYLGINNSDMQIWTSIVTPKLQIYIVNWLLLEYFLLDRYNFKNEKKEDLGFDYIHIRRLFGFIFEFFHISNQH
jgi:hypothetical protein